MLRPPSPASLSVVGVSKRYGHTQALDAVSLELPAGACLALVGESGSGKTTLLRMFNRMVEPDSGRVLLDGAELRGMDPVALRRSVGYVPQEGGLLPHWRVLKNAALVPWLQGEAEPEIAAAKALALVGLEPERFGERWPRELSGGQQQRVAIARALAARPRILLLDEAFGALDAITRGELHETFLALREEVPVTTVLVTHDLAEAATLAQWIAVMHHGRVEQHGAPREVFAAPATDYVARLVARSGVLR
ncbi:MAG: ATP-binding cassette domain-containing protein [Gemmatimonadetes bacterium]|nr:ATP-binding cassette domain-containing protein [Gemmatimonadota bacterium]